MSIPNPILQWKHRECRTFCCYYIILYIQWHNAICQHCDNVPAPTAAATMKADTIMMIDDDDNDNDDGNLQITYMCETRVDIMFSTIYAHADVLKYAVMCAHVN